VQKCFKGYQVRIYFKELKKATILVQSLLKGKRARKEYGVLKHRSKIGRLEDIWCQTFRGIIALQKCFRGYQVRIYFKELKKAKILVQSLMKGKRARN